MKNGLKAALVASIALAGICLVGGASAMPMAPLQPAITTANDGTPSVEHVYYYRYYRYHYYRPYHHYHYRHYYHRHFYYY